MKKWCWIILLLVIIAAVIGGIVWHRHSSHKPVATVTVKRGDIHVQAVAVGSIVPQHSITVKSQLSGIVSQVYHQAGDYVHRGEKLLRIHPNPTPLTFAKAIAQVQEDKIKVTADKKLLANYHYLLKHHIIPSNYADYIKATQSAAVDQLSLENDQQNLSLTQKGSAVIGGKVMHSVIVSPITGYILSRDVDTGDPVVSLGDNQAATVLFTIANMKALMFRGSVDQIDAGKLHQTMPVTIHVAALPKVKITGVLTQLALQSENSNQQSNSGGASANSSASQSPFTSGFQVEVSHLSIPAGVKLRSGYTATATIIIKTAKHTLLLPERVIVFKKDKAYVHLPGKDNKPVLHAVTLGISDGLHVQIKQGLLPGEKVLSS